MATAHSRTAEPDSLDESTRIPPVDAVRRADRRDARWFKISARVAVVVAFLLVWEWVYALALLDRSSFPSAFQTIAAFGASLSDAAMWLALWDTLRGALSGLAIGVLLGVFVGIIASASRWTGDAILPIVHFVKNVPAIAILPIVIVILGSTTEMKIFLVAFGVFWPMAIQTAYGIRSVDPTLVDTSRVLRIGPVRRVFTVLLPSAAPYLATGLRLAVAVSLILAITAELVGGAPGLGSHLLMAVNAGPDSIARVYAYVLVIGCVGVILTVLAGRLERATLHWHEAYR